MTRRCSVMRSPREMHACSIALSFDAFNFVFLASGRAYYEQADAQSTASQRNARPSTSAAAFSLGLR
jgi:hypothetical protein